MYTAFCVYSLQYSVCEGINRTAQIEGLIRASISRDTSFESVSHREVGFLISSHSCHSNGVSFY